MICPAAPRDDQAGGCEWCGLSRPKFDSRFCTQDCLDAWAVNHQWGPARIVRMRTDSWTCRRCGYVGWSEMPPDVFGSDPIDAADEPARTDDWVVAFGYLEPPPPFGPIPSMGDLVAQVGRFDEAADRLPLSVRELITRERIAYRRDEQRRQKRYERRFDLDVVHIRSIRRTGYTSGCSHHQENLETVCRNCLADRQEGAA